MPMPSLLAAADRVLLGASQFVIDRLTRQRVTRFRVAGALLDVCGAVCLAVLLTALRDPGDDQAGSDASDAYGIIGGILLIATLLGKDIVARARRLSADHERPAIFGRLDPPQEVLRATRLVMAGCVLVTPGLLAAHLLQRGNAALLMTFFCTFGAALYLMSCAPPSRRNRS